MERSQAGGADLPDRPQRGPYTGRGARTVGQVGGRRDLLLLLARVGIEVAPDGSEQAQDCYKKHDLIKRFKSKSHLLPLAIKPIGP